MTVQTIPALARHPDAAFTVKAAAPQEIEVVRDLLLETGLSQERASISVTFRHSTYWIARLGGEAVGCAGLEHGAGASLLRSVAVLPWARGLGVGRALAQSALTLASLRGDGAVYLFSSEAGGYWQRLGFAEVPVNELAAALPDAPQVRSGLTRGWLSAERAWKRVLTP